MNTKPDHWPSPDDPNQPITEIPDGAGIYAIYGCGLDGDNPVLTYIGTSNQLSMRLRMKVHRKIRQTLGVFPSVIRRFLCCSFTEAIELEWSLVISLRPIFNRRYLSKAYLKRMGLPL